MCCLLFARLNKTEQNKQTQKDKTGRQQGEQKQREERTSNPTRTAFNNGFVRVIRYTDQGYKVKRLQLHERERKQSKTNAGHTRRENTERKRTYRCTNDHTPRCVRMGRKAV